MKTEPGIIAKWKDINIAKYVIEVFKVYLFEGF